MNDKIKTYIKSIILVLIIGGISSIFVSSSRGYDYLVKPNFAPPNILFPIVWTILYILMGISYGILKTKNLTDKKINKIYYIQLLFNLLWPLFYFTFGWRLFAFIWLVILNILIAVMIIKFYNKNKIAGILQIPYLIWSIFASILNLSIYVLNK